MIVYKESALLYESYHPSETAQAIFFVFTMEMHRTKWNEEDNFRLEKMHLNGQGKQ